jgi:hypothetical protein
MAGAREALRPWKFKLIHDRPAARDVRLRAFANAPTAFAKIVCLSLIWDGRLKPLKWVESTRRHAVAE